MEKRAPTATTGARLLRTSLIGTDLAAHPFCSIEFFDGVLFGLVAFKIDEGETANSVHFAVDRQGDTLNNAILRENFLEILLGSVVRKIANVNRHLSPER
ncbi:hypothetical protein AMR42_10070 [Limnothrix sp. PR1529]|nr:hypothetical protein BCR12_09890 [Limnothrix sp. P13C2]PIB10898.1 hypothetical protein AMR42_10070 [Limnothrix sp. PR1529]